ncbi:putative aminotransferase ACS10-like [Hibiscus syriacus]|uniref:Aminotransferase ACS10-like n=1 Tax=Hibiscus syriacus TaxID=106335 RepID=A0A6A2YES3_HIBSY|nr:putative aminotransferase ACS10-like [Hibiscus syriacus]
MEEDIEMEIEPVFEVREIDLDYEFDAVRFFDFTREESPEEAGEAELWFESAPTYPPSPFVKKLVTREENLLEIVTTSPKCVEEDTSTLRESEPENLMALEFSAVGAINEVSSVLEFLVKPLIVGIRNEATNRGITANIQKILQNALNQSFQLATDLTTYNHLSRDKLKAKSKSAKPMQRSSTLMKPTASQLAKQNCPPQAGTSRFQKQHTANSSRSLGNSSVIESQAAKRQKLEGGLLRKVDEVKQRATLVHKAPKKEGTKDRNAINTRLRLTIPREPELETAHRAQRIRPKNCTEEAFVTCVSHRFKARPLNRKNLEGPSLPVSKKSVPKLPEFQEFHLKTLERAVQLSSAVSSSSIHTNAADKGLEKPCTISANGNGTREARRPSVMDATSQDVCDTKYNFKARPLNRKEFNFQTKKSVSQNPPVDHFSKLSLTSELQPSNGSQMKSPRPSFTSTKIALGSKENRFNSFQPEHEVSEAFEKGENASLGEIITKVGNQLSISKGDVIRRQCLLVLNEGVQEGFRHEFTHTRLQMRRDSLA